jgi:hypothetical protein
MTLVRDIRELSHTAARSEAAFTLVAEGGRSPMRPPLFILGPATEALLGALAGQVETPALGCYALHDTLVAPTGFPVKNGAALHGEAFLTPRHLVVSISDRLNSETLPVREVGGSVALLCGPAHETYGHWLVDFLPRLFVLAQAGHDVDGLRFLVPADLRPFGFALLDLCGIPASRLVLYDHWRELLRVEHLLMPTGLRRGDRLAPAFGAATAFWLARAGFGARPAGGGGALYLARRGGTQRVMVNRARIEAIAAEQGFAILHPEDLPLREQIGLFAEAGIIVGEYGSALHNAMFAGMGAAVCALRGTSRHPSLVQSGIATALGQDLGYVFGATEGAEADQAFYVEEGWFRVGLEILRLKRDGRRKEGLLF